MNNEKMECVKEESSIVSEIRKQEELIVNLVCLSEEILKFIRGCNPEEDKQCLTNDCMLDTLKMNSSNIRLLDKNISEIAKRIMG